MVETFSPQAVHPDPGLLVGHTVLVAGGTGNVGRYIVRSLLERGAVVVVPSRSQPKLDALRQSSKPADELLVTLLGDVAEERDAARVRDTIMQRLPSSLSDVVASLGGWVNAPSLLGATRADLVRALDNYVVAHFTLAHRFLPVLAEHGGASYTLINGPSASTTWPGSALVSVATAAQAMLARALLAEDGLKGRVEITELVIHPSAYIGPDATTPGSGVDGWAVGRYVAGLMAGRVARAPTLHLESPEQLRGLP